MLTARTKSYLKSNLADGTAKEVVFKEIVAAIESPKKLSKAAKEKLHETLADDKAAAEIIARIEARAAANAAQAAAVAAQAAADTAQAAADADPEDTALQDAADEAQDAADAAQTAATAKAAAVKPLSKRSKPIIIINLASDDKAGAELIAAL